MTATEKKPNARHIERLQAVIATNRNTLMTNCGTLLKVNKRVSLLQCDAKIQKRLEALKNPPKSLFKIPPPPRPPMDVEQATLSLASLPPTAMSLLPMTRRRPGQPLLYTPRRCCLQP
uniref:Uncharacterized protein n=1 Tax=Romanomermis culicivorax TaxID=13658 RepID=A0A915IIK4_ROMCU